MRGPKSDSKEVCPEASADSESSEGRRRLELLCSVLVNLVSVTTRESGKELIVDVRRNRVGAWENV